MKKQLTLLTITALFTASSFGISKPTFKSAKNLAGKTMTFAGKYANKKNAVKVFDLAKDHKIAFAGVAGAAALTLSAIQLRKLIKEHNTYNLFRIGKSLAQDVKSKYNNSRLKRLVNALTPSSRTLKIAAIGVTATAAGLLGYKYRSNIATGSVKLDDMTGNRISGAVNLGQTKTSDALSFGKTKASSAWNFGSDKISGIFNKVKNLMTKTPVVTVTEEATVADKASVDYDYAFDAQANGETSMGETPVVAKKTPVAVIAPVVAKTSLQAPFWNTETNSRNLVAQ
jgi:hypothetical protein